MLSFRREIKTKNKRSPTNVLINDFHFFTFILYIVYEPAPYQLKTNKTNLKLKLLVVSFGD